MIKKTTFLIAIISVISVSAQKYQATVAFKNGTTTEGYADEIGKVNKKNQIAYKANKDAEKQMFSLDDLAKITYHIDNKTAIAEPITVAELKDQKVWAYKLYAGKLNAYTFANASTMPIYRFGNYTPLDTTLSSYIFQYKDEPAHLVSTVMDAGPMTINTFQKKYNLKMLNSYFSNKCPQVNTAYEKGEIKFKKDPMVFLEYFEKNCN